MHRCLFSCPFHQAPHHQGAPGGIISCPGTEAAARQQHQQPPQGFSMSQQRPDDAMMNPHSSTRSQQPVQQQQQYGFGEVCAQHHQQGAPGRGCGVSCSSSSSSSSPHPAGRKFGSEAGLRPDWLMPWQTGDRQAGALVDKPRRRPVIITTAFAFGTVAPDDSITCID
jgi:hypothetical protein